MGRNTLESDIRRDNSHAADIRKRQKNAYDAEEGAKKVERAKKADKFSEEAQFSSLDFTLINQLIAERKATRNEDD
ncbi:MAG: hypothetical protein COV78_00460 [Candidatus Pacebacteria bacterium CG11_big_fil_rev_8_21_14_0_20_34_55]|nr:MAG: hypothetical protein COV78_00460 [Candidatus Pacebacteria bacterium CG11_big_fil_rev_8_21_14_0_20_34_55]